jgi:ABC-type branched-subunit amino acid transport system ATPase component
MILLQTKNLGKSFGGLTALSNVDLSLASGEIASLIGPNGAGKTTFFNLLTGVYKPDEGRIEFSGERIDGQTPYHITRRGIARTFQNIRLFNKMTVLENVMVGRHCRTRSELFSALLRIPSFYREEKEIMLSARERLQFVGLLPYGNELAGNLPYGAQRRLEIARALATEPRLLLLDEPTAGMNQSESQDTVELIQRISKEGVTILLIEHRMSLVMKVSQRVHVLDHGVKIAEGTPSEVQAHPKVIEAYLGSGTDTAEISNLGHA